MSVTTLRAMTLKNVDELRHGFDRITFEEFCTALGVHGASRVYAETKWPAFQTNPIAFCAKRNPIAQGEALFALAMEKAGP